MPRTKLDDDNDVDDNDDDDDDDDDNEETSTDNNENTVARSVKPSIGLDRSSSSTVSAASNDLDSPVGFHGYNNVDLASGWLMR
ncbi:hypothetical protein HZH68_006330 [Vespula germanica]|uniref:Uncharacterized protein n=1 Tax=Vespula germanica TaxID=30212 RepID=A0A834KB77_VESGE|nr:hypothetical protein HZH68_006330 [Vespula germanica]